MGYVWNLSKLIVYIQHKVAYYRKPLVEAKTINIICIISPSLKNWFFRVDKYDALNEEGDLAYLFSYLNLCFQNKNKNSELVVRLSSNWIFLLGKNLVRRKQLINLELSLL